MSPRFSGGFAQEHDEAVMRCLGRILHLDPSALHPSVNQAATLPFSLGGSGAHFGLAKQLTGPVGLTVWRWSEHATPLSQRESLGKWAGSHQSRVLCRLACALALGAVGVELPSWSELANGVRPLPSRGYTEDQPRHGWQREVSMKVEEHFKDSRLLPTMTEPEQALLCSQGGPLAALHLLLPHGQVVSD